MADDKLAATLDAESKRLQIEAEKASYREAVAKAEQATAGARAATLGAYLPNVTEAPRGEVTVGQNAGAFGAWRAHQLIDAAAKKIVEGAVPRLVGTAGARVLIVGDRTLLPGDWTARHVRATLDRLTGRIGTLDRRLRDASEQLRQAVARFGGEETSSARTGPGRRGGERPPAEATPAAPGTTPTAPGTTATGPAGAGYLGAAVNLLGLLRTDYAITATAVTAAPSQLATLTAAHLATWKGDGARPPVVADEFTTVERSPSMDLLASVLAARDRGFESLSALQGQLAPVEAELAGIKARIAPLELAWATAIAEGRDRSAIADLRGAVDLQIAQAAARERAAGPARFMVAQAQQIIADVDAAVTTLLEPSGGNDAPLLAAVRRERLDAKVAADRITHVLYVHLDAVAAEAVTRRSILGMSGRIRFISTDNASWLLLDAASGEVADGGQVSLADVMTFDLEGGNAEFRTDGTWLTSSTLSDREPLAAMETWAKMIVLVLAVVLFVVGALSVVAMVKVLAG